MRNPDNSKYYRFTGPARLDKAVHTLEGILRGVTSDGKLVESEYKSLVGWLSEHLEFVDRHPFNEIVPRLHEIISDRKISDEEKADILWLCDRMTTANEFYDVVTADVQRLQGYLAGVIADGNVTGDELAELRLWLASHEHLRTCWPYDEIDAVVTSVMRDGRIDESEQSELLQFFSEFSSRPGHRAIQLRNDQGTSLAAGVCAACPQVEFLGRVFCFTGKSQRCTRAELATQIEHRQGRFAEKVSKDVHYLVVGADGNRCWAFACYGRKVEQAVNLRREGHGIVLVHESDFWDAWHDAE